MMWPSACIEKEHQRLEPWGPETVPPECGDRRALPAIWSIAGGEARAEAAEKEEEEEEAKLEKERIVVLLKLELAPAKRTSAKSNNHNKMYSNSDEENNGQRR